MVDIAAVKNGPPLDYYINVTLDDFSIEDTVKQYDGVLVAKTLMPFIKHSTETLNRVLTLEFGFFV